MFCVFLGSLYLFGCDFVCGLTIPYRLEPSSLHLFGRVMFPVRYLLLGSPLSVCLSYCFFVCFLLGAAHSTTWPRIYRGKPLPDVGIGPRLPDV